MDTRQLQREVWQKNRDKATSAADANRQPSDMSGIDESEPEKAAEDEVARELTWRDRLLAVLQHLDPSAFERLCQRMLREAGFLEVEVTGRSGDGGIDGHGIIRIGGLISFTVLFQSKRHIRSIGPDVVRDFRGAMVGRADKGLIITTALLLAKHAAKLRAMALHLLISSTVICWRRN